MYSFLLLKGSQSSKHVRIPVQSCIWNWSHAWRLDIPTCKEEEELHLCQGLAQTLPLPNGEWNEVVVFFHLACSIQEALWAKLCAINPVVTLCSTVYFFWTAWPVDANLFFDIKKNRKLVNIQPSLHFYGIIFWWKKGLCIGKAWLPFQTKISFVQSNVLRLNVTAEMQLRVITQSPDNYLTTSPQKWLCFIQMQKQKSKILSKND